MEERRLKRLLTENESAIIDDIFQIMDSDRFDFLYHIIK